MYYLRITIPNIPAPICHDPRGFASLSLFLSSLDTPQRKRLDSLSGKTRRQAKTKLPNPTPSPRPRSPTSLAMSSSSNSGKKPAPAGGRGGPTIRTLADINRGPAGFPGAGGGSSDDDEPQEYYTGGEKRYISASLGGLCFLIDFAGIFLRSCVRAS